MKVQFYLARPVVKNEKGKLTTNPSDTSVVANVHLSGKLMRIGTGVSADPKYWNPKAIGQKLPLHTAKGAA